VTTTTTTRSPCPRVDCTEVRCPYGFETDGNGCQTTCQCRDLCDVSSVHLSLLFETYFYVSRQRRNDTYDSPVGAFVGAEVCLSWHSTTSTRTPTSLRGSSPTRPIRAIDFLKLFLWQAEQRSRPTCRHPRGCPCRCRGMQYRYRHRLPREEIARIGRKDV